MSYCHRQLCLDLEEKSYKGCRMKTNEMTQSELNTRTVFKRAVVGVPIILVVAFLVTGGDDAPIQWLFAYFNSPAVLWTVGIIERSLKLKEKLLQ